MVLAGLGFIGYFAWQYWGTNYVAKQKQAEIKQLIVEDWDKGIDGNAIGLLRVPRFGDDYEVPIVKGGDLLGAKGDRALAEGVAWYEPGAKPGEIGNFAVAGHRATNGEPFATLDLVRAGDVVVAETRTRWFTYVVDRTEIVDPTATWVLDPVPGEPGATPTERLLTLTTCNPRWASTQRLIVFGHLRESRPKSDGRPAALVRADGAA